MSTSDGSPLELPCCEGGVEAYPDPCPWHPGEIKLPPPAPGEKTSKQIVEEVFREMGIEPGASYKETSIEDWDIKGALDEVPLYRAPEKPVPYLGDRRVIPWGLLIFFLGLAIAIGVTVGWSLNELGLL